jgi:predicted transcriptional regulator
MAWRTRGECRRQAVLFIAVLLSASIIPAFAVMPRGSAIPAPTTARESILGAIEQTPGIHFRELMSTTNRTNGVVQYNLQQLELRRDIFSSNFGHLKGYFPAKLRRLSRKELVALIAAHHPVRLTILGALLAGSMCVNEIAAACGIKANKILFHVQKMVEEGILTADDNEPEGISISENVLGTLKEWIFFN